jgi:hypothetical protein
LQYGNQAEMARHYASVAIIAKIPVYAEDRGIARTTA